MYDVQQRGLRSCLRLEVHSTAGLVASRKGRQHALSAALASVDAVNLLVLTTPSGRNAPSIVRSGRFWGLGRSISQCGQLSLPRLCMRFAS